MRTKRGWKADMYRAVNETCSTTSWLGRILCKPGWHLWKLNHIARMGFTAADNPIIKRCRLCDAHEHCNSLRGTSVFCDECLDIAADRVRAKEARRERLVRIEQYGTNWL